MRRDGQRNVVGGCLAANTGLAGAGPFDTIWFGESKRETLELYLRSGEVRGYLPPLEAVDVLIDGFQSPLGMEALATVDWLITNEGVEPTLEGIHREIRNWPAGHVHARRKERLFHDRLLGFALDRLQGSDESD